MSQYSDGETCDVLDERLVKARKSHHCDACGGGIRAGDVYSRTAALYDGSWETVIRCGRCETIFNHLEDRMRGNYDEFPDWRLACGHEYRERWGEEPPPEIAALAFMTDEEAGQLLRKP